MAQPPPARLQYRTREEYRQLSNDLLSLASQGRIAFALLKNISLRFLDFAGCDIVEMVYPEKGKVLRADARRQETPAFFCSTLKTPLPLQQALEESLRLLPQPSFLAPFFDEEGAPLDPSDLPSCLLWTRPEENTPSQPSPEGLQAAKDQARWTRPEENPPPPPEGLSSPANREALSEEGAPPLSPSSTPKRGEYAASVQPDESAPPPASSSAPLPSPASPAALPSPASSAPLSSPGSSAPLPSPASPAALLVLPVSLNGAGLGVLLLGYRTPVALHSVSREALEDVSTILGLSLSHNLSQFELRERVKELSCMYRIAHLAARPHQRLGQLLQKIAELLPPAYLYPAITEARIVFDGFPYQTSGFAPSEFCQTAEITVGDEQRGQVEVVYCASRPELDEGPFLNEERHLLDSVAREIAIIVERRQAEKEQASLQEQLRHADRLATIGQLAAGVAHELNEPLTSILGFAELLQEIPQMPSQAASDLQRIESASLHAREVVRKLLLFARQIPPKQRTVNINRVIDEVGSFFESRCHKENIQLCCDYDPELPDVFADEAQIRQIVLNLVVNAIQAMPQGGEINLTTRHEEEQISLSVRDSGEGIPPPIKEKIFLPFFTTKDINQGTGLGLSVVHGIVKAHHGRIEVHNHPQGGACFVVFLPVDPPLEESP